VKANSRLHKSWHIHDKCLWFLIKCSNMRPHCNTCYNIDSRVLRFITFWQKMHKKLSFSVFVCCHNITKLHCFWLKPFWAIKTSKSIKLRYWKWKHKITTNKMFNHMFANIFLCRTFTEHLKQGSVKWTFTAPTAERSWHHRQVPSYSNYNG